MAFLWDARRAPRTAVGIRVMVECGGSWYRGTAVDLNEHGIGVHCALTLHSEQRIIISFPATEDGSQNVTLEAIVRHTQSMRHGCEFVMVSDANRQAIQAITAKAKAARRTATTVRAAAGM
jgi:PilZ domain